MVLITLSQHDLSTISMCKRVFELPDYIHFTVMENADWMALFPLPLAAHLSSF